MSLRVTPKRYIYLVKLKSTIPTNQGIIFFTENMSQSHTPNQVLLKIRFQENGKHYKKVFDILKRILPLYPVVQEYEHLQKYNLDIPYKLKHLYYARVACVPFRVL